jgi:hypothetical protein
MALVWFCVSFDYYLITFYLKYLPGSIFVNSIVSSCSEALAIIFSGIILKVLSIKNSLLVTFMLSAVSCIGLIIT